MDTPISEVWKETDFSGVFVSNMGRVKRADGLIYKLAVCQSNGYRYAYLSFSNHTKAVKVARLVAKAFIPNPDNKPCVDHINTIRTDDRVENLRWVTRSENMRNPLTRIKCFNSNRKNRPERMIPILQFLTDGTFVREWDSATSFSRSINKDACGNIVACIKGRQKTAYGYIWKYK